MGEQHATRQRQKFLQKKLAERNVRADATQAQGIANPAPANLLIETPWVPSDDLGAVIPPPSPADALATTFTSQHDSALDLLAGKLIHVGEATLRVADIEQRLGVFAYANETEPSVYTELLYRAAGNGKPLNEREQEYVRRIQGYLVGELNPAIYELQQEVTAHVLDNPTTCDTPEWHNLARPNGVWDFLQTGVHMHGEEGPQHMQSLFGLMESAHTHDAEFPTIDVSTTTHPTAEALHWIGEVDPLDSATHREYWETRLAVRHDSAPHTIPNEIRLRSGTLVYNLEHAAKATTITDRERQAYETITHWVEQREQLLRDNMSAEELAVHRATMHFARGNPEDVINLLNAAETIKETNPNLFLRMVGVAPGRGYSQSETARSDMFGNVFQLSLYRSLHLVEGPSGKEGLEVFRQRVRTLLDFSSTVPDMLPISSDQMRAIEQQFKTAAGEIPKDAHAGTAAIALTGAFLSLLPGYRLRRDLEGMLQAISLEEREQTLQQLRTASPDGFIQALTDLSDAMSYDPDIQEVVFARLKTMEESKEFPAVQYAEQPSTVLEPRRTGYVQDEPRGIRNIIYYFRVYAPDEKDRLTELRLRLWESTPDSALLSDEFQKDVLYTYKKIQSLNFEQVRKNNEAADSSTKPTPSEEKKERMEVMNPLIGALAAHPDIRHEQWLTWYDNLKEVEQKEKLKQDTRFAPLRWLGKFITEAPTIENIWRGIFSEIPLETGIKTHSTVFAIRQRHVEGHPFLAPEERPSDITSRAGLLNAHLNMLQRPRSVPLAPVDMQKLQTLYRFLQQAYAPKDFVAYYGNYFVQEDFTIAPAEDASTKSDTQTGSLAPYFDALPEKDRRELLAALIDPQLHAALGWREPFDKIAHPKGYKLTIDALVTQLNSAWTGTAGGDLVRQKQPDYFGHAYNSELLTPRSKPEWRVELLHLADRIIPDDPHLNALQSGEYGIDPVLFHAAYPEMYQRALYVAAEIADRFGYGEEVGEMLAPDIAKLHLEPFDAPHPESTIACLPPRSIEHMRERCLAMVAEHAPEEIAAAATLRDEADAAQYVQRLRELEIILDEGWEISLSPGSTTSYAGDTKRYHTLEDAFGRTRHDVISRFHTLYSNAFDGSADVRRRAK